MARHALGKRSEVGAQDSLTMKGVCDGIRIWWQYLQIRAVSTSPLPDQPLENVSDMSDVHELCTTRWLTRLSHMVKETQACPLHPALHVTD